MKYNTSLFFTMFLLTLIGAFATGEGGIIDIGIAMPETHVERWQRDGSELKQSAQAKGYTAAVAYADADQSKQNKQIEDFVTKGAKLIIIGQVNEGAAEAVEKASAENVIIIAYDRLIVNSDKYDYYITFDNYKVGQIQGRAIEEALNLKSGKKKTITFFAGAPTDNNAKFFFDGALDVLRPYVQKKMLRVVGPSPLSSSDSAFSRISTENWQAKIAKARMENLLNGDARNITLDAVLAPNDTLARAIIEALSSDKKYDTIDKLPIVVGQDGELASIKMIKEGKQHMTVFKDTRKLSSAAIELADALLKNKKPSIAEVRTDTKTYNTGKKVVTSYLLAPVKVTKDTYKKIMIDSGYYNASQIQ